MKKLLLLLFGLTNVLTSFSQIPSMENDTEKRFLKKSVRQKTKAPIYIGLGAMAAAGGITMYTSSTNLDVAVSGVGLSMMGGVLLSTGALLLRSSARNKKRAVSLAVRRQSTVMQFKPNNYSSTQTTVVLVCILHK